MSHRAPDARSDLFSLGAVLHTLLAGNLWVAGETLVSRIEADDALDVELRKTLLAAVDPDPAKRHPSVAAFKADLIASRTNWAGRSL